MAESPFPEIPPELLPKVGEANKGWLHLTDVVSQTLPTNLRRANLIRRGALAYLNVPRKPRKH